MLTMLLIAIAITAALAYWVIKSPALAAAVAVVGITAAWLMHSPGLRQDFLALVILVAVVGSLYIIAKRNGGTATDQRVAATAQGLVFVLCLTISGLMGSIAATSNPHSAVLGMDQSMPQYYSGKTIPVKQANGQIRLAAQPTGTGTGSDDEQWRQYLVANPKSNFVLEGLLTQEQIAALSEAQQLVAAKEAFLAHSKRNVFLLTTSAKNGGFYSGDVNDIGRFVTPVNDTGAQYLSDEGRSLYDQVAMCANTPGALSFQDVSPNSINTGFSEGGVSESQGITGNLKALVITCTQKGVTHQMKILVRCGNNVFEVSVAPQGHTDEQPSRPQGQGGPPPSESTTTRTTTETTTTQTTSSTPSTSTTPSTSNPSTSTTSTCPPEHPDCKNQSSGKNPPPSRTPASPPPSSEQESSLAPEPSQIDPTVTSNAPVPSVTVPSVPTEGSGQTGGATTIPDPGPPPRGDGSDDADDAASDTATDDQTAHTSAAVQGDADTEIDRVAFSTQLETTVSTIATWLCLVLFGGLFAWVLIGAFGGRRKEAYKPQH